MERTITAALLISLCASLSALGHAPASAAQLSAHTSVTTLSGVCSLLLFLRVRRPRGPR